VRSTQHSLVGVMTTTLMRILDVVLITLIGHYVADTVVQLRVTSL
jgi:hypothetical protein